MDYPWNIKGTSKDQKKIDLEMDWDTIERIEKHLGTEEKEKVLKRNIINFMM